MLEYLKEFGNKSSNPIDQAIEKMAEAGLIIRKGEDIPFPAQPIMEATERPMTQNTQREAIPEYLLTSLRAKYEGAMDHPEFHTPAFQTQFWRDMFADDPSIIIPERDWTEEEIRRPMTDMKGHPVHSMLVFKPTVFNGQDGLLVINYDLHPSRSAGIAGARFEEVKGI